MIFEGRSANKDAHNLASFAFLNDFDRLVWFFKSTSWCKLIGDLPFL
jgi:hypothetical protein